MFHAEHKACPCEWPEPRFAHSAHPPNRLVPARMGESTFLGPGSPNWGTGRPSVLERAGDGESTIRSRQELVKPATHARRTSTTYGAPVGRPGPKACGVPRGTRDPMANAVRLRSGAAEAVIRSEDALL